MGSTGGDNDRLGNGGRLSSCVGDPFSAAPPELRHRPQNKGSLRHVECPSCGQEYWTNRETDFCMDCETDLGRDPPRRGAPNGREGPAVVPGEAGR